MQELNPKYKIFDKHIWFKSAHASQVEGAKADSLTFFIPFERIAFKFTQYKWDNFSQFHDFDKNFSVPILRIPISTLAVTMSKVGVLKVLHIQCHASQQRFWYATFINWDWYILHKTYYQSVYNTSSQSITTKSKVGFTLHRLLLHDVRSLSPINMNGERCTNRLKWLNPLL